MYVYVEPYPKGTWGPIDGYTLEFQDGAKVTQERFPSQKLAVNEIKLRGYRPLVATVRVTDKADTAHWQPAEAAA